MNAFVGPYLSVTNERGDALQIGKDVEGNVLFTFVGNRQVSTFTVKPDMRKRFFETIEAVS